MTEHVFSNSVSIEKKWNLQVNIYCDFMACSDSTEKLFYLLCMFIYLMYLEILEKMEHLGITC